MHIRYPLLLPMIGHGATDIIDLPISTLQTHFFMSLIVYLMKENERQILLLLSSIIHISRDIPHKNRILLSACFHKIWLWKPIIAKLYLLIIHTPTHYIRNHSLSSRKNFLLKSLCSVATTILSYFSLQNNIDIKCDNLFGKFWWTAPVVGHIILNEKINKINANKYKEKFVQGEICKSKKFYLI